MTKKKIFKSGHGTVANEPGKTCEEETMKKCSFLKVGEKPLTSVLENPKEPRWSQQPNPQRPKTVLNLGHRGGRQVRYYYPILLNSLASFSPRRNLHHPSWVLDLGRGDGRQVLLPNLTQWFVIILPQTQ